MAGDKTNLKSSSELVKAEGAGTVLQRFKGIKIHRVSLRRTEYLVYSFIVRELLKFGSNRLASFGLRLETFLNSVSGNFNLFHLFLNLLKGKGLGIDKSSAAYMSMSGFLDKRWDLDKNIKREEGFTYFSALSAMASKLSYENAAFIQSVVQDRWKMKLLGFLDYCNGYQQKARTQGFMFLDEDTIVVAFRGTEPFDADALRSDFEFAWHEIPNIGKIHKGFVKALRCIRKTSDNVQNANLAYDDIRDAFKQIIKTLQDQNNSDNIKIVVTGHSLGGALAILFVAMLVINGEEMLLKRLEGVYTFGQPRVCDANFADYMDQQLKIYNVDYFRFVYGNDIVPRVPYDDEDFKFKHFGTCIYYDRHYNGKVVKEEPNKNYFSKGARPRRIKDAFLEIIRSFTIVYEKGVEYKETWLLRTIRILGIGFPGGLNHFITEYINATRIGILDDTMMSRDVSIV